MCNVTSNPVTSGRLYDPLMTAEPVAGEMTIDELAQATGSTVRNIRAHQSRGLLPPPVIRARTGYYGAEHVRRLRMIQAMQAEGFRLDAIARLIKEPGAAAEQIFEFGRSLLSSFGEAPPEFATTDELVERYGGPLEPRVLRKAEKLGLIRSLGDDRWEIRNPTLVAAGEQLAAIGTPLMHALAVAEKVDRHTRAIAKAYVRLFLSDVMGDGATAARSEEDWKRLNDAVARLRPLATEAMRASFEQAMAELVEDELKDFIERS
jgi:DNA-binding transcriptional MerR regulator